jgi:CHAT domain-containing protein
MSRSSSDTPDQAEALLASIPDSDGPGIRDMVLRTRGNLRLAQGRYQESLEAYNGALKQAQGVDAVYQRMWLNEGIARSQLGLKNRPAALAAYRNAVELADTMRAKFRSDEFKAGLFGDTQRMFEDAIALAVATGNFEEAWRFSERSRARALLDMIRERTTQHATAEAGAAAVIDSATLRKALRDDEAIVEYHALEDQLVVWVIRRDGITGAAVPISRADLTTSVEGFRRSIVNLQRSARTKARDLYDVLIAKVALRNGERLIVVPHGPLHYLPFQALYDGKTYLIENHSVSVAPSASVVYQAASASVRPGGEFVGFGNPDLGKAELALPGAQREVQQISGLFANARVYYQRDATKARFRDTAGKSGMLHVAAHAEVDEVDPLYSRVLLAPDDKDSGRLEAREIFDLDLSRVRTGHAVACESGLGKVDRGDEIIGFTRSFLSAGVSGLIVSLWPVSDESTELLMSTMYQQLRSGQSAQDAMRAGQVALLQGSPLPAPVLLGAVQSGRQLAPDGKRLRTPRCETYEIRPRSSGTRSLSRFRAGARAGSETRARSARGDARAERSAQAEPEAAAADHAVEGGQSVPRVRASASCCDRCVSKATPCTTHRSCSRWCRHTSARRSACPSCRRWPPP